MTKDSQQRAAGAAAALLVENDTIVGLGTGATASYFILALVERVKTEGLRIKAIPTSKRSDQLAEAGGIELTSFAKTRRVDLTVDGADQIQRGTLHLVKGLGGALLREKIVAAASDRLVIIAESAKLVDRLGGPIPVPVEVVRFGWETTAARLAAFGCEPKLRWPKDGNEPLVTELGNYILDCAFPPILDPAKLEQDLSHTVGVVESGLFIGMADMAIVGTSKGVETLTLKTG